MKKILLTTFFGCVGALLFAQNVSKFIVVDQFGYLPNDKKIAVIRDPQTGFDAAETFTPGTSYALVDASNKTQLFTAAPTVWNKGAEDSTSGDKAWWFDFSSVTEVGEYYVLDISNNVKSYNFSIAANVYDDVLKHAVRSFYYQRSGYEKKMPFAGIGWEDGASHIGPLQDKNCRPYNEKTNASKEKDVSGGWYDAGDLNKYTIWTGNYVYEMLQAYEENPNAWTDDYNLPKSGNGIPDLIDEAKWGMDHLLRLQNADGSVISIVSVSHASPPSAAKGQSLYGAVNTSSAWSTASVYAYGAKVFRKLGMNAYADSLQNAAVLAYTWAEANPSVIWKNNDAAYSSKGIGSGQQEVDDYSRLAYRLRACAHLLENTGEAKYKTFFEANYTDIHLMPWYYAYPYENREQETLLYYTTLSAATTGVKTAIKSRFTSSMTNSEDNLKAVNNSRDPYRAHIGSYTWGSNSTKSLHGTMFMDAVRYNTNPTSSTLLKSAAEGYVHYLHGVNPMNLCYLSNMYEYGAENSVNQFYHTWFTEGSSDWDEVGVSTYGPAPGFLTGGPNPSYDWDGCCPNNCGGAGNNAACNAMAITPPKGQPRQKSYLDFNANWPLNSWAVTENSCGYQIAYIRLLSNFVDRSSILNGVDDKIVSKEDLFLYPNPSHGEINMDLPLQFKPKSIHVTDLSGRLVLDQKYEEDFIILSNLKFGTYIVEVIGEEANLSHTVIIW